MFDYFEMAQIATQQIKDFGKVVTLWKLEIEPADPNRPWEGATVQSRKEPLEVFAVFVGKNKSAFGRMLIRDELLNRVDQVALIAPVQEGLTDYNLLADAGTYWTIDFIETLKPADITLLHTVGLKK